MHQLHVGFAVFARLLAAFAVLGLAAALPADDFPTPVLSSPPLDPAHRLFSQVLGEVVHPDGVDYARLRTDHRVLDQYRAQLAAAAMPTQRDERLALLINAYNAFTLALVAEKLPADRAAWATWSIKDAGGLATSVWKLYTFELAGGRVTLDQLENAQLRPLGEPRIHFAINCASKSCPALASTPYTASGLDAQFEAAARAFAASPRQVQADGDGVSVNPILRWFDQDFTQVGGVRGFLLDHAPAGAAKTLLEGGKPVRFRPYDWTLNQTAAP
jgi:hypothetical protein